MNANILIVGIGLITLAGFGYYSLATNTVAPTIPQPTATSTIDLKTVNGVFEFDPSQSQANWSGSKNLVANYVDTGTINIKSGKVYLNQGQILSGELIFDMSTIATSKTGSGGEEDRLTKHLKSDDFFSVTKYPEAKFVLTEAIRTTTNSLYNLKGNLTIKDKTAPVSIPVSVSANPDGSLSATGQVDLDRTVWNRYGSEKFFQNLGDKVIDDNFRLEFSVVALPTEKTDEVAN